MLKNDTYRIYLGQSNNEVTINKFNASHQYTILEQINSLPQNGYAVFNHLYTNPGFEEDFEHVFLNREINLKNTKGFDSLLFLRPHSMNEHYVIITIWEDEEYYKKWQNSREYKATHQKEVLKKEPIKLL
ncbi:antibiotic biosynthesis monooxygenase [Staphylococcus ureilyticus]